MSDSENDSEISFSVKFLGRLEVVRPVGMEILMEATESVQVLHQTGKKKKSKVHLFLSRSSIDILEHKTKFMLYSCTLSSVSFCAVHQSQPKVFGFMAKHPALDSHHCYIFQSSKFSHLLVSVIADAFRVSRRSESVRGSRDLVVEALRHKNKVLQRENAELRRKLKDSGMDSTEETDQSDTEQPTSRVRFNSGSDTTALLRNF